jgi:peptide deformylase
VLLTLPDDRLRQPATPVSAIDDETARLVGELRKELDRTGGLGLAAPQIGVLLQVALVRHEGRDLVLINPRVIQTRGSMAGWEGCLSVPHMVGWVKRPERVTVEALDASGKMQRHQARGLAARVMLHELDHLAGRLYVDGLAAHQIVDTRLHPTPPAR